MFLKLYQQGIWGKRGILIYIANTFSTRSRVNVKYNNNPNEFDSLESLIKKYENRLLYNSVVYNVRNSFAAFIKKQEKKKELQHLTYRCLTTQPLPISLKFMNISEKPKGDNCNDMVQEEIHQKEAIVQFPFSDTYSVKEVGQIENDVSLQGHIMSAEGEVIKRYELMRNWMTAYENFDDSLLNNDINTKDGESTINYGMPDPGTKLSNVPCGGCGALLHCKDTAIPGYLPSEIFKQYRKRGGANLESLICQRCFFLKNFNVSLQVRVSSEDYPKVLQSIRNKKALVVLMVDLLDFPCSMWPGIADIIGPKIPLLVVGNKVDLIPKDNKNFLTHIKNVLLNNLKLAGFATSNIKHVALISAKTGYGIEDLITSLHSLWRYRGDVYLVGCTNVGKSSLFNALLKSDYCKVQASDLIQRATTSQWPGTTLNLLKFPIMRLSGYRVFLRNDRIKSLQKLRAQEKNVREEQLQEVNSIKNATLYGHIGQSYNEHKNSKDSLDAFSIHTNSNVPGRTILGVNEADPDYALCKWCYDTPGVVQTDQIVHLLTAEELMFTLPKELIRPQTFCIKPETSLFLAGLARLDYTQGPKSIRLTVFRSSELPITICPLKEADALYTELLGTSLLKIPFGIGDRLKNWPGLEPVKSFTLKGDNWKTSCSDIVLSNAGWIAVSCGPEDDYHFEAWTPEKRGFYLRDCLLPNAVNLRGPRIHFSPAYKAHRFI